MRQVSPLWQLQEWTRDPFLPNEPPREVRRSETEWRSPSRWVGFHVKNNQKRSRAHVLTKQALCQKLLRDLPKRPCIVMKWSTHQELTIINIRTEQYCLQNVWSKNWQLKKEIESSTIKAVDFNTSRLIMDRKSRQVVNNVKKLKRPNRHI